MRKQKSRSRKRGATSWMVGWNKNGKFTPWLLGADRETAARSVLNQVAFGEPTTGLIMKRDLKSEKFQRKYLKWRRGGMKGPPPSTGR